MPPPPAPLPEPAGTRPRDGTWPWPRLGALLLAATLLAYLPSLGGEFLWDDEGHVTRPELRSWAGLGRIWTEVGATQQYYPLLHSAFWVQHRLWGDAPVGYRLSNVLWHALSALLLAAVLRRLAVPGAVLAALAFALHPVAVESVAWIAEQKNTLSTFFYLGAALLWLRFDATRRPGAYAGATALFVAALLTKTVTATLPAALLVIAWWRRGSLGWRGDVAPLLPWFALGIGAGLGTAWLETHQIGAEAGELAGPAARVVLAGRIVWFYLGQVLWPADLAFFYPRWTIDPGVAWQWLFPVAALAVLAGLFLRRARGRGALAAALLWGGTLFPALGFFDVYPFVFSYVADHFQYLALPALLTFLAAAATRLWTERGWSPGAGRVAAAGVLAALAVLTWRQAGDYRNEVALYEATLARNPDSWAAHLNLGTHLVDTGRPADGLPHLQRAHALRPGTPEVLNSLADALQRVGRPRDALPLVDEALRRQPRFAAAHNTRGATLMTLGRADEGIAAFRRALEMQPRLVPARVNLGWALANGGQLAAAVAEFAEARRAAPGAPAPEFKWGLALASHGRVREALPHLARAVELAPADPELRATLGRALADAGRAAEARPHLEEALRRAPGHPGAREVLDRLGR